MTTLSWLLYGLGWLCGWAALWSTRALPPGDAAGRRAVAVVVPARDEADALAGVLGPLAAQMRPDDELVVADDRSTDATASVAAACGARVLAVAEPPAGWVGKPHACWHGATATGAPVLVFLDADVRPGADLLAGLTAVVDAHPDAVVSVQPWHDVVRPGERVSVLANVVSLMGSGAFTALGARRRTDVAFGPVVAVDRGLYERIGGHADPAVRCSLTEDIALARRAGRSVLFTSRRDATFRMYPGGLRQALAGWSRTLLAGIGATRWWLALVVAAWVASLAGGMFAGWIAYPLSAAQVWVLGRRAGRFGPVTAALYPLAVVALLVMLAGAVRNRLRGVTAWKGREVVPVR